MKYYDGCSFLKVSRWHDLWRSNIPNLSSLKQQAEVSGFVAIDAEPWGNSLTDIAQIGIAFVPLIDIEALQGPPTSLGSLQTRCPIQVSSIRVAGRKQGRRTKREPFVLGPTHIVEPDAVHETLQRLFKSFRDALGPQASLTLIGFDLTFEFRVMSSTYLGITEHVSSWVDLQEIIKDVSSCTKHSPSMRESLIAFGFEGDGQAIIPNGMAHSAGIDVLRIIALLVNLLALSPDVTLQIDRHPGRKFVGTSRVARRHMKVKNQFAGRPSPREFYPFRARVTLNGSRGLNMRKLADSFSKNNPSAIGTHGGRKINEGYVCLPSFDELDEFIKQTHGSTAGSGQFWEAISEFDPELTAARTASELSEFVKAATTAAIEHKRVLRKQKKENEKIGSEESCSDLVDGVDDLELGELWV